MEVIVQKRVSAQTRIIRQQCEIEYKEINQKYQSEREKLLSKFKSLENDFECVINAAKKTEYTLNGFRSMIYDNILLQKYHAEKEIGAEQPSWLSYICCI
jgi:septal ring factor EnvC (AmiA/AmiB activator)